MKNLKLFKLFLVGIGLLITSLTTQVWANTKTDIGGDKFYFKNSSIKANNGNTIDSWQVSGGKTYFNFWGGNSSEGYSSKQTATNVTGDVYKIDFPSGNHASVQLVRGNSTEHWNHTYEIDAANFANGKNYFWCDNGSYKYSYYVEDAYVYFDKSNTSWNKTIQFWIGRSGYTSCYAMTNIPNTKLYYYNVTTWGDYNRYRFVNVDSYSSGSWSMDDGSHNPSNGYTAVTSNDLIKYNSHNLYTFGGSNGGAITKSEKSAYTDFNNITIYIKEKYNSSGAGEFVEVSSGTAHGTISASGYIFNSWTTCSGSATGASITKETETYSSSSVFGYTSTVTLTAGATKAGKAFVGWYRSNGTLISTDLETTIVAKTNNETVYAYYKDEETHDVTVSYKCGATILVTGTTESAVGVSTTRSVTAPAVNDHTWSSWTKGSEIVNRSANLTTNPIVINTSVGATGSYCTLQANYTLKNCSISVLTESNAKGDGTKYLMSYDYTEKAYYYDFASSPSNLYFRFIHADGGKWSADWNGSAPSVYNVDANGSKVTCSTDVHEWEYKATLHFSGLSGSAIRVYFDFVNKKTWITEPTYTVTISSENTNKGTVSPSSVTAGKNTVSGSFTATPKDGYKFKQWSATTATLQSSATTNPNTVKTTAAGSVQAQFDYRWVLRGSINSSDDQHGMPGWSTTTDYFTGISAGGKTGTITVNLEANTKYKFKVYDLVDASYYSKASVDWTGSNNVNTTKDVASAITFTTTASGPYTFTFNFDTKNVAIAYPTSYAVNFYAETFVNGGASHSTATTGGIVAAVDGYSVALTSGWKVKDGGSVVITASKKTGYTFNGFYTSSACTTAYEDGEGVSISDNVLTLSSISAAKTVYAKFSENITTVNLVASPLGKGTFTKGDDAVTSVSAGVTTKPTVTAVPGTGYHLTGTIWSESSDYITLSATNTASTIITATGTTGNSADLTATFTPNTYTVQFHRNGASESTVYQDFTYDVAQNLTANSYTRTGYTFGGWSETKARADAGDVDYTDGQSVCNLTSENTGTFHLYASWTAKTYTLTLDVDEENHGDIASATTEQTVTYAATVTIPNKPTAAEGYAFMGYFTDQGGEGLKVIGSDGNSIANVTGYTDGSGNWKHDDDATLYAYYKKAEITELTLSAPSVAASADISVTPTIAPTPAGTTKICWEVQYNNGTALPSQPSMSYEGNTVTFKAPGEAATYRIECKLYTGSSCGGGTLLDTRSTTFQVAGEHKVTVVYQDTLGRTLSASTEVTAQYLAWSSDITAPTVPGYSFHHWILGDGITINTGASQVAGDKTTQGSSTINIKATYAGTLTAVYYKNQRVIYFNNTLGWSDVYVYFYNSDKYWNSDGSGAYKTDAFDGDHKPYWEEEHGHMTQIEGTNIWYFDYGAAGYSTRANVVFTEANQHGYHNFYNTKAARRGDHKKSLQMFVPLTTKTETKNGTDYYSSGYWMNYPDSTGYVLKFYSTRGADKVSGAVDSIAFPFSADKAMPLKLEVEFNTSGDRYFMIQRCDGNYYGANYDIKQGYNAEQALTSSTDKLKLIPSAKGIYTFTLTYHDSEFYIDVDYPIAVNDYRIKYSDNAAWSGGTHGAGWYHPSDVINKIGGSATEAKKDIVSLYIAKDNSPSMKFQYASAIDDGTGAITWTDVTGGGINLSSFSSDITAAGVYNIYVSQPVGGGSITVDSIKPYKGNYYIRTDCAGSTKWDSYTAFDHHMTYSDYAENYSYTDASKRYTHYYAHWYTSGNNIKFCIANDYSSNVSDTLEGDYYTAQTLEADANIRFMWNEHTNKLSRAYIAGSGDISKRFLVLEGNEKMYDENGNALTGTHQDHDKYGNYLGTDNQVVLHDDENFVYERTIKVNTGAPAKLTAKYNSKIQYLIGDESTTIELLGGSAEGKHKMRIVYDFKTNRLVKAYLPEGEISSTMAINADLMIIREHQEDGQQITFNGGSLTDVKTVYGVMRFNRWTLNNKSTINTGTEESPVHAPLGDPKSAYERSLYWISFPFDVNLSDVFGFGTYGVDWIIEEYDGAGRAAKGFWKDSPSFWKYITNRSGVTLEAGKGYVLALELDNMKDNNTEFWVNNIEQIELFFPSADNVGGISETTAHTTVEAHTCTIDRTGNNGSDINKNRTKADSHWNIIGVPSYANYGTTPLYSDNGLSTPVTWNATPYTNDLPFLYEWNMVDNTYTVQSGTTYPFKAMHSYYVQYQGDLYWKLTSAPTPIVARSTYEEAPQKIEFRMELQQNEKMVDQTFVKLSNDVEVSANFEFGEDLSKEFNKSRANIYTLAENWIPAAGNTLPMSEQTTVVPVGVKTVADGEYVFSMPEGTSGVGVTLVDNETGVRTSLGLMDYTVTLSAGTHDNRFTLEISPIKTTPTGLEEPTSDSSLKGREVRKVLIDQQMYIIKDGKVFDARGAMIK